MEEIKQYGFVEEDVEITPEDWVAGSDKQVLGARINHTGNWKEYLPVFEHQARQYETFGCTVWGGLNQIETLHNYLYGEELNFWERFNYVQVGIRPPGTNPHKSYESFRNDGLVSQKDNPDSYEEFIEENFPPQVYAEGENWKKWYDFSHDWIVNPTKQTLKDTLPMCPPCVSVTAWIEENGFYVDNGQPNSHWCEMYSALTSENVSDTTKLADFYRVNEQDLKKYLLRGDILIPIFDSYDKSHKLLHPSHRIAYAKRITYQKRQSPRGNNWLVDLFKRFRMFV